MTRHYLVRLHKLPNVLADKHRDTVILRPTPWKLFFSSFFNRTSWGFVSMDSEELDRFVSQDYAAYFDGVYLQSNGDKCLIQPWSLLNVCKFCVEGLQYYTFWRITKWKWKGDN